MAVASRSTIDVRDEIIKLRAEVLALRKAIRKRAIFEFTGDGSTTAFALPAGWKPFRVSSDGSDKREGSGDDYTVSSSGSVWTVTFATAPGVVFVQIEAEIGI